MQPTFILPNFISFGKDHPYSDYHDLLRFANVYFSEYSNQLLADCPVCGETFELEAQKDYSHDELYIYCCEKCKEA